MVSLRRLRSDAVTQLLTQSLVRSDNVARNCDAVSKHSSPNSSYGQGTSKEERNGTTLVASSAGGVDAEALTKLMMNEYAMVNYTYNVQKSQSITELLQMKIVELKLKAKELKI
ncbi:hypothetical protein Tco_0895768 [Tanacetum coccineum]|uniref:Uncharacterized protein n=1 Tax=Tanacetum coccineum TaxID=301880 RepID=A0ABQ5CIZ1_9ASTR